MCFGCRQVSLLKALIKMSKVVNSDKQPNGLHAPVSLPE